MNTVALDFVGEDIVVGSKVAFIQLNYRNLLIGYVTKVTPKTVMIAHKRDNCGKVETKQFHDQVVVLND
jgi:hypothetical protein